MKKVGLFIAALFLLPLATPQGFDDVQEEASGVAVDGNGDVIITGFYEADKKQVARTEKYDGEDGKLIWSVDFDTYAQNVGKAVAIGPDGSIYVGGAAGKKLFKFKIGGEEIELYSTDYLIIKYTSKGEEIWNKTYDNGFGDYLMDIGIDDDGDIYATGMTMYLDITSGALTNLDFWTIKVSQTNGELLRKVSFDVATDAAFGIDIKGDDVIVIGSIESENISKYCIVKYDKNLEQKWVEYYYEEGKTCVASDAIILSNKLVVTGNKDEDFFTICYAYDGEINKVNWKRTKTNSGKDDALSIASDSNGNIIVAGYMSKEYQRKWYLVKYDGSGKELWNNWGKGDDVNGEIKRVITDANNNIIAAGYKKVGGSPTYCVRKYSSNGEFLWEGSREAAPGTLEADFIWLPENPTRADVVHFYDKSTKGVTLWHWDFGDGSTSTLQNPKHKYENIGKYNVTLQVTKGGMTATITKEIEVSNALPYAEISYSPLNPIEGQEITFDASSSYDPDGSIVNYTWNFGDGNTAYGKIVSHVYSEDGNYTLTLTLKDNDGGETEINYLIIVNPTGENIPPVAHFELKERAGKGEKVKANASQSHDEDGTIKRYKWDWDGDGIIDNQYSIPQAEHIWYEEGEYKVTLIVEDDKGYQSTYTKTIKIGGIPELIIEAPSEITLQKGKEKEFTIKVICHNKSLYNLSFSFTVGGKSISLSSQPSTFDISSGDEKQIRIIAKANEEGTVKIQITGKDIEKGITIESNTEEIAFIIKQSTPSFTLIAFIVAIGLSMLLMKTKRK